MNELENKILPESRKWNKLCIEHFYGFDPVLRGPCFSAGVQCSEIQVICCSNPSVLAVKTYKGNLLILVGAGDLIPSFSVGEPSIEWSLYEEFPFKGKCLLLCLDFILYLSENTLYKIELPWLAEIKECYIRKKAPKNLPASKVSDIRRSIDAFDMILISKGINKFLTLSLAKGYTEENLRISSRGEPALIIDRKYLECELKNLPEIALPKTDNIRKTAIEIPPYEGEEYEVINLLQTFDEYIDTTGKPLANKVQGIKERMEECSKRNENLMKNYEILTKKLEMVELFSEKINDKISVIEKNDEEIRGRIQDIVDIQQNVKRPLTQKEKELSNKLTMLENMSKNLKNHATDVIIK